MTDLYLNGVKVDGFDDEALEIIRDDNLVLDVTRVLDFKGRSFYGIERIKGESDYDFRNRLNEIRKKETGNRRMNQKEYDVNNVKMLINGIEIQDFDDSEQVILARNVVAIIDDSSLSEEELVVLKSIPSRLEYRYLHVKQEGDE